MNPWNGAKPIILPSCEKATFANPEVYEFLEAEGYSCPPQPHPLGIL